MGQSKPIGSDTILIVEDEAIIRFELIDLFEEEGYRVYAAANADEAIALLDRHGEVRVVLTDVEMPGSMDGLKLAHYIRERGELEHVGATAAIFEEAEAAVALARLVLADTGAGRESIERSVRDIRTRLILDNVSTLDPSDPRIARRR